MRKLLFVGAVVAAVLVPSTPRAGVVSLGARTGIGIGAGDVGGTLAMSEWVAAQIPFQFDLLFRLPRGFALGGYLSLGAGIPGDACDNADCTALITRLGFQATYTFPTRVAPWLGAGFGYEWNMLDDNFNEYTFSGLEFLNLQGGVDFTLGRKFKLGPFAMVSFGEYDSSERNGASQPIAEQTHEWITFGVRGKFDL